MSFDQNDARSGQEFPPSPDDREPRLPLRRDTPMHSAQPLPQVPQPRAMAERRRVSSGLLPSPQGRQRSAVGRRLVFAGMVLGSLAVLSLLIFVLSMRSAMHSNLPQLDGRVRAPGLAADVTVQRDPHGVVTLTAATLPDLLFAQGYVTASDRMWQMDALRRHAAGELAEVLGPSMVAHDKLQRTLQLRDTADRAVRQLPADQLAQLQAYSNGVNAWLATHADTLPLEFHLLRYKPTPWTPRDSLLVSLVMFQDLSTEFPGKLNRESFSAHMPPSLLPDLYPVGSWRDHPPGEMVPDLTTPREQILQIPLDPTQTRLTRPTAGPDAAPADLLRTAALLPHPPCESCRNGSNNWAVAGTRTSSGEPLVSNDMHLQLGIPDIWYEAGLHLTDGSLDVAGVTLPGVPFVIVGRNAHVAWGFTAMYGDVQDIAIEHLRGSGQSAEYQRPDGSWAPVVHHVEQIRVRAGRDVTLDVQLTEHGVGSATMLTPIISGLYPTEKRALALKWTAYDLRNLSEPFLRINEAATGAELVSDFENFGGPPLNLVYGDDAGHIGFHAVGRIPVRGPLEVHPVTRLPENAPADGKPAPLQDEAVTATGTQQPVPSAPEGNGQPEGPTTSYEAALAPFAQSRTFTIGSPIPAVPIDALDPNATWTAYVPYEKLPAVTDPVSGFVATANSRVTPDNYPYHLAIDWVSPYRTERITHRLEGRTGLKPADMLALQMDIHSEFGVTLAQRLAYAIDHASAKALGSDAARLRSAANLLRRWDGEVAVNSAAANLVGSFREAAWPMLLVPQLQARDSSLSKSDAAALIKLYSWGEQTYALEQILTSRPARWLPAGNDNWDDFMVRVLAQGLADGKAPDDLASWTWGKNHSVQFTQPVLSSVPWLGEMLGVKVNSGPRVIGGDGLTVKQTAPHFGPSQRFTADLGVPGFATMNLTTGQSGNPASPWYLDQLPLWLGGETLKLPLDGTVSPAHTLTLTP